MSKNTTNSSEISDEVKQLSQPYCRHKKQTETLNLLRQTENLSIKFNFCKLTPYLEGVLSLACSIVPFQMQFTLMIFL